MTRQRKKIYKKCEGGNEIVLIVNQLYFFEF